MGLALGAFRGCRFNNASATITSPLETKGETESAEVGLEIPMRSGGVNATPCLRSAPPPKEPKVDDARSNGALGLNMKELSEGTKEELVKRRNGAVGKGKGSTEGISGGSTRPEEEFCAKEPTTAEPAFVTVRATVSSSSESSRELVGREDAMVGGFCFLIGTSMFYHGPVEGDVGCEVTCFNYNALMFLWSTGSSFFTLGGLSLAYRHAVMKLT